MGADDGGECDWATMGRRGGSGAGLLVGKGDWAAAESGLPAPAAAAGGAAGGELIQARDCSRRTGGIAGVGRVRRGDLGDELGEGKVQDARAAFRFASWSALHISACTRREALGHV